MPENHLQIKQNTSERLRNWAYQEHVLCSDFSSSSRFNALHKPAFRNECKRWGVLLPKLFQNSSIGSVQRKHKLKDFIVVVHLILIKLFLKSYIFIIKTQRTRTYVDIIQKLGYNIDNILSSVLSYLFSKTKLKTYIKLRFS